jgi:hypothetical protein
LVWRVPYVPECRADLELPAVAITDLDGAAQPLPGIFFGAVSIRAFRELGLWQKLAASEALDYRLLLAIPHTEHALISQLFPPSKRSLILLSESATWQAWRGGGEESKSFGVVVSGGRAKFVVVGLPTEEVWDEFLASGAQTA